MAPEDKSCDQENDATHEFGSFHTAFKLEILRKYLPAYTTALAKTPFALHYLDAFAGTGMCTIKLGGEQIAIPGSASIAIGCEPNFARMVFIEKSLKRARALEQLKAKASNRRIEIIRSDANSALPAQLRAMTRKSDRGIVFLDPYGMQVHWETLREIASSQIADLWYLFPLSGLYRQASLRADDIDEDKAAALTRILGTEEWRTVFYGRPAIEDLFDKASDVRTVNVPQMLGWVKNRLESVFPAVADPKPLYQVTGSGKQGAPLFALFFAVSNPSPKAIDLAMRIGKAVLK
jgi:three-Cys-motif partner protein